MVGEIQYWLLRNHDLFTRHSEPEIHELCKISELKRVKRNEIIYSHKNEKDRVYVLSHGRIKIAFRVEKGIEVVSEILKDGDIFGELTLNATANINCEFAQVLSAEALICSFKLENFENILASKPGLALRYAQMVGHKLGIISNKYCDLVYKNVRSRVINFFKLHAQYEGKWTGEKAEINMLCNHQDIADFTASSRQTVSTVINNLVKEKKIIYEGRSKVIIPNIKELDN